MQLIPVTETCNQKCVFCSALGRKDSPSPAGVMSEIRRQIAAGAGTVILSGGETTLCGDIFRIIRAVRAAGVGVELQTNGLTSSSEKTARALVMSGVTLFNINFPSHIPAVNDEMTGTSGTLERRASGVANILRFGGAVRLTHIISSLNYSALADFASYVVEKFPGVKYVQFSYLKGMGGVLSSPRLLVPYADVSPYLIRAFGVLEKTGVYAVADHIPPCFMGRFYARNVDYIKLESGVGEDIVPGEKAKLPGCRACVFRSRCAGPRKEHVRMIKNAVFINPVKEVPA